ncbi:hypothetical protein ACFW04_006567 [Cataglyphis niger]
MDVRWKHLWTSIVCGPMGCGKTIFVKTFFRHLTTMLDVRFERILFYYAEKNEYANNTMVKSKKNIIKFHKGLPCPEDYSNDPLFPKLVIIDDLMRKSSSCDAIVDLFTKGSHHKNLSVILISQNLFHQRRGQRDISLNANYIIVLKNPRDRAQIHLARQVYPDDSKFMEEAYYDATSRPHEYLLLDLKQSTSDEYRFRTCIFPDDTWHYAYVPRRSSNRSGLV